MSITNKDIIILAIESSCDDTSAAIIFNGKIVSNIMAGQAVHKAYGGVVPELASRAHQQNIVPVVEQALEKANVNRHQLSAIAFTNGPGLLGSLLVGVSFAKSLAMALGVPLIEVNHMQAHILAHHIDEPQPSFPYLCLTVSGGHSQIVRVNSHMEMTVIGQTLDDAAGEAFDKAAKTLGLPYPGGPLIDKHAIGGDAKRFEFAIPKIPGLNYSFSGIKTAFLYLVRDKKATDPDFIDKNLSDLCASIQLGINNILMSKLKRAARETKINEIAIAGGVAANSGLRLMLERTAQKLGWRTYVPAFEYCTDNAAMIAITAHYKYLEQAFADQTTCPSARMKL